LPPDFEKRNEDGVNKNTYFVTNDLTVDWIELPDVKPSQIRAARNIRYIFSGNLNRLIITNPHFPGTEKEYLRCQIARITHGTKIEPSINHWKVGDSDNPSKPLEKNEDDDVKKMKMNDLISIKNWIHFPPAILKQGRVSHYFEIPEEIENPDEYKNKLIEKDPFESRIKSVFDDAPLLSSIPNIKLPAWKLQYVYDDKIYINPFFVPGEDKKPEDFTSSYVMVSVRSLRWPGSFTIHFKNENYFLYFGWGHKFADYSLGEKFVYQDFPIIPKDIGENEEYPEPNSPPHEQALDAKIDSGDDNHVDPNDEEDDE
jgi:radial spoke head protein 4A